MDSIEVTLQRTAAAAAVAAQHLARKESVVATICGCGDQARAQLTFFAHKLPIARIHAFDTNGDAASAFAREMTMQLQLDVRPARNMAEATSVSDVIVTCTTSHQPFLRIGDVRPGTFIVAVGADSPEKSELFPELLARSKVVVDSLIQCMAMGDLHHAVVAGAMVSDTVHATLGEVVTGRKSGRTDNQEITIFDSTGIAVQDVTAALEIHARATTHAVGLPCRFGAVAQTSAEDIDLMTSTARLCELRR